MVSNYNLIPLVYANPEYIIYHISQWCPDDGYSDIVNVWIVFDRKSHKAVKARGTGNIIEERLFALEEAFNYVGSYKSKVQSALDKLTTEDKKALGLI